jgi:hypothetical protein
VANTTVDYPDYIAAPSGTALRPMDADDLGGAGTAIRPRTQIGGTALAEIARVVNGTPASSDYGVVTRPLLYDASGNPIVQTLKNGQFVLPVWGNAVQLLTSTFGARNIATGALTANTAKAVLSLEVAAAGSKTVKIRRILVSGYQTTALAGLFDIQLSRGSAASSAGTAVTGGVRVTGDTAPTVVVKTLPTITAATILDVLPLTATPTAVATGFSNVVLYDWQEGGETKPWTLKPGVLDSLVLSAISTAAQNWLLSFHITVSEE